MINGHNLNTMTAYTLHYPLTRKCPVPQQTQQTMNNEMKIKVCKKTIPDLIVQCVDQLFTAKRLSIPDDEPVNGRPRFAICLWKIGEAFILYVTGFDSSELLELELPMPESGELGWFSFDLAMLTEDAPLCKAPRRTRFCKRHILLQIKYSAFDLMMKH